VRDLQRDRQQLSSAVLSLRQNLKSQLQSLKTETHSLLTSYQQQRQKMQQQQAKELAASVIFLQAEVQDYLDQLAAQRPIRAAEIQQMLKLDRIRRQSAIETLFQELAAFHAELRQYRQTLSQSIWGEAIEVAQADELSSILTAENVSSSPIIKADSAVIEQQVAVECSESIEPAAELVEPAIEPAELIEVEPAETAPIADPWIEADQPTRALLKNEERVHGYLAAQQGARLTEIETLGLTRFQIVDALRSLTQKGLIQQRDRLYFAKD